MLCSNLQAAVNTRNVFEFDRLVAVLERDEMETPQIVYRLACRACGHDHSLEIPSSECPRCGESTTAREWKRELDTWLANPANKSCDRISL